MKAIMKIKAVPGLEMHEIDKPCPQQGEVIVKVDSTGICGSDIHIYEWTSGYEWLEPYFPTVLGHEFSGTVEEAGEGVDNSLLGKRVVCMPGKPCFVCNACSIGQHNLCQNRRTIGLHNYGSFTNYVSVPLYNCFVLDDNTNLETAALAEPLAVAANAVELAGIKAGETVAVLGPGPIGLLCAFLARKSGATSVILTGTNVDRYRLELGKKMGADVLVNVEETDPVALALEKTGQLGVDHVFEASGSPHALKQGIKMMKSRAGLVLVGIHSVPVQLDMNELVRKEKRLIGAYGSSAKTWQRVTHILAESGKQLEALITHRVSLEEGIEGFRIAKDPKAAKVIIKSS